MTKLYNKYMYIHSYIDRLLYNFVRNLHSNDLDTPTCQNQISFHRYFPHWIISSIAKDELVSHE